MAASAWGVALLLSLPAILLRGSEAQTPSYERTFAQSRLTV
jgi:hypothetical protein